MTDRLSKVQLPLSRTTTRWLNDQTQTPTQRLGATWRAAWNDINWRLSRALLAQQGDATIQDPLLIVGPWRSGTTAMHELLCAATGNCTPQTWQCMNAPSFMLTGHPKHSSAHARRPMDAIAVSAESPQEDEFALLTLGAPTAYRAFLAPERLSEMQFTLSSAYWLGNPDWLSPWTQFLLAVLSTNSQAAQPLLLKSPNHTFRLPSILRKFPNCKIVWMTRDPELVFQSNRKMWLAMCGLYSGSLPDAATLDRFLSAALLESARLVHWCQTNLPREQFVMVRQETLREHGTQTVNNVATRFGLQMSLDNSALLKTASDLSGSKQEAYSRAIPDHAKEAISLLGESYRSGSETHGL